MIVRTLSRYLCLAVAILSFGVGVVGIFVPLLPTTVFMLIAVWAASRSSPRFAIWLRDHPRFGPAILAWERERAIPRRAKILACLLLTASCGVIVLGDLVWWGKGLLFTGLVSIAAWIITRPTPRASSLLR
ncbi:YbaN family protein [Halomonas halocynthiae]|uniref:YbaN family protein n=1 Tax=Halomonas halocynthiae TaxID=176290 RepID=UPI0003F8D574|nr:YbaN family protein [Halomonas halocynthiae]